MKLTPGIEPNAVVIETIVVEKEKPDPLLWVGLTAKMMA